jgi:hypothetical protein
MRPSKGRFIPSRFSVGLHDALHNTPNTSPKSSSYHINLLAVLNELCTSGKTWATGKIITTIYEGHYQS